MRCRSSYGLQYRRPWWPHPAWHTGHIGGASPIRRLHAEKRGLRCLGVAESFGPGDRTSTLAGVVMRRDGTVDGAVIGGSTVSGDDATDAIAAMHSRLDRCDISCTIVSGLLISMYNVINVERLAELTQVPAIGVTYRESGGLDGAIRHHFESPARRLAEYASMPARERMRLHTGHDIFVVCAGCTGNDAAAILDSFTRHGAVPEPLRVARTIARAARVGLVV